MAEAEETWLPIIGRSLAYLCMKSEAREGQGIQRSAQFLEGLGLSRSDVAAMLGTTPASIAEMHRQARQKKGKGNGSKKKKSAQRR